MLCARHLQTRALPEWKPPSLSLSILATRLERETFWCLRLALPQRVGPRPGDLDHPLCGRAAVTRAAGLIEAAPASLQPRNHCAHAKGAASPAGASKRLQVCRGQPSAILQVWAHEEGRVRGQQGWRRVRCRHLRTARQAKRVRRVGLERPGAFSVTLLADGHAWTILSARHPPPCTIPRVAQYGPARHDGPSPGKCTQRHHTASLERRAGVSLLCGLSAECAEGAPTCSCQAWAR